MKPCKENCPLRKTKEEYKYHNQIEKNMNGFMNGIGGAKKCLFRKTGEAVEVIASCALEDGARTDGDWVSYIDSKGVEHIKEHLNIQFDFKEDDPWRKQMEHLMEQAKEMDQWELRRYELAKEFMLKGHAVDERDAVAMADNLIAELKKSL